MTPGEWAVSIAGTPTGETVATGLALLSALAHACFGALQKGRHDPWMTRAAVDFNYLLIATPIALIFFPLPEPALWPLLAGVIVIHAIYKTFQAMAYDRGSYTAVYPVVRGTGPLATVIFAMIVFGEVFGPGQWLGVLLLSGSIIGLAVVNIRQEKISRARLRDALILAVITGMMVAIYTTYDAYGIRLAQDPFTFIIWFFIMDGLVFPVLAIGWYRRMSHPPALGPLFFRGFVGTLLAFMSFGAVMLATRLDKVGEAAALRETSVVFAALIGWLVLGEKVGRAQAALMVLIAVGAVLVELG